MCDIKCDFLSIAVLVTDYNLTSSQVMFLVNFENHLQWNRKKCGDLLILLEFSLIFADLWKTGGTYWGNLEAREPHKKLLLAKFGPWASSVSYVPYCHNIRVSTNMWKNIFIKVTYCRFRVVCLFIKQ